MYGYTRKVNMGGGVTMRVLCNLGVGVNFWIVCGLLPVH